MCILTGFTLTLSRHLPTACGGIGDIIGIGAGPIMDGIGGGMVSTSVGEVSMRVGLDGMVPVGDGTILIMVQAGVGIILIIAIGDHAIRILHDVPLECEVVEEFHAIHRARGLQVA